MTDDAGDYVLGEDVLSDLWLLLEPLAEEASADLPLATPPGTPGAGVRDHTLPVPVSSRHLRFQTEVGFPMPLTSGPCFSYPECCFA